MNNGADVSSSAKYMLESLRNPELLKPIDSSSHEDSYIYIGCTVLLLPFLILGAVHFGKQLGRRVGPSSPAALKETRENNGIYKYFIQANQEE